ncbi:hypothetical protein AMTRI_Chr02g217560 [Amborella trichopoda]|uniref:Uncharacterized protein n=1 Tax=Amborella trichopoda TaxID=13333 RepID=W1NNQ3_AMBTC|nr:hypothetical protein AMTR_s00125p00022470 [Amborella trichopoda]
MTEKKRGVWRDESSGMAEMEVRELQVVEQQSGGQEDSEDEAEMVAEMGQQGDRNGRDGGGCRRAVVVGVERWWRPGAEQVIGVETRGGDVIESGEDGERLGENLR